MNINIHSKSKKNVGLIFLTELRIYFFVVKTMSFTILYISSALYNAQCTAVTLILRGKFNG